MSRNYPFYTKLWPRSIATPEQYEGGSALTINWEDQFETSKARAKIIAAWVDALPRLTQVKRLCIWARVNQVLFDAICLLPQLEELEIKWSSIQSLDAIGNLRALKALKIGSSTQIQSIAPLTQLSALEFLEIENFKLITDFSPLVQLRSLHDLSVTGDMWTKQKMASVQPFSEMTWLHYLFIDTSCLSSIRELAALTQLKELGMGGRLPYTEYAWLAAKLPNTQCDRFQPYNEVPGHSPCKPAAKIPW